MQNNNNNNNNNINFNSVDSSNIVANFNTNNANQVNIMPGAGRKKRSAIGSAAVALFAAIKVTHISLHRHFFELIFPNCTTKHFLIIMPIM